MKKLASTLPNMIISLGTITALAGAILGEVYSITKEPIARQEEARQIEAIQTVAPPFNNNPEAEKWEYTAPSGIKSTVYPAYNNGELVGAAVKSSSMNGFAGEIVLMVGFYENGSVYDYQVLQHAETPGLGSKMEAWFRNPEGTRSIIRKCPDNFSMYVRKDTDKHGEIDGITAATISSRAFLEVIRDAYEAYKKYAESKGVEL